MIIDLLDYERLYIDNGATYIAGIDEAGRGPLAGPVVAACAVMPLGDIIEGVTDSKLLTEKKRNALYAQIIKKAISYKIAVVDNTIIDDINILNATKKAMMIAVKEMNIVPDVLLVDAVKLNTNIINCPIVKGDLQSYSIAAASILAKVYRDNLMCEYAKKYPEYGFERHKGYGTVHHIEAIKTLGTTPIHRKTFLKNYKKYYEKA